MNLERLLIDGSRIPHRLQRTAPEPRPIGLAKCVKSGAVVTSRKMLTMKVACDLLQRRKLWYNRNRSVVTTADSQEL